MTENRIFTLCHMITCCVFQNVLKFYQQLTGEERRIPSFLTIFTFAIPELLDLI